MWFTDVHVTWFLTSHCSTHNWHSSLWMHSVFLRPRRYQPTVNPSGSFRSLRVIITRTRTPAAPWSAPLQRAPDPVVATHTGDPMPPLQSPSRANALDRKTTSMMTGLALMDPLCRKMCLFKGLTEKFRVARSVRLLWLRWRSKHSASLFTSSTPR